MKAVFCKNFGFGGDGAVEKTTKLLERYDLVFYRALCGGGGTEEEMGIEILRGKMSSSEIDDDIRALKFTFSGDEGEDYARFFVQIGSKELMEKLKKLFASREISIDKIDLDNLPNPEDED
jgi:hypothetical protein